MPFLWRKSENIIGTQKLIISGGFIKSRVKSYHQCNAQCTLISQQGHRNEIWLGKSMCFFVFYCNLSGKTLWMYLYDCQIQVIPEACGAFLFRHSCSHIVVHRSNPWALDQIVKVVKSRKYFPFSSIFRINII